MTYTQLSQFRRQLATNWAELSQGAWRPMLAVHLAFLIVSTAVLTPLGGLSLRSVVALSGQKALSDTEIASFLLSPAGALAGILVAAVLLTLAILDYAALLVASHAVQSGQGCSLTSIFARIAVCAPALLRLSLRIVLRYLAAIVPFAMVIALSYWLFLSGNDINYYLAEHPPEFITAVGIGGVCLILLAITLIKLTVSWFYALPLVLFSHQSPLQAKRQSAGQVQKNGRLGERRTIVLWLSAWLFGTPLCHLLLTSPIQIGASWLIPKLSDRLPALALVLGFAVLLNSLISFILGFLTVSLLAHQNIRMFKHSGLEPSTIQPREPTYSSKSRIIKIPIGEKAILGLGILIILVTGGFTYHWLGGINQHDQALVIAHRGASLQAPENTMAAIQLALESGADWVEIDVQETADGEIVVFHDSDFKRVGGKALKIWDATTDQLAGIEIGSWFDPRFASEKTPSLKEVLNLCRDRSGVLIELKYYGHDQQLEQRVIDIVEQENMQQQIMLMSLNYEGVQKVRQLRPDWKVGLLSTVALGDITKLDVDFLGLNSRAATKSLIRRAHRNNIEIYVWTVNDPIDISTMASRGADGLITDDPATARQVIQQRHELDPGERLLLELAHIFGKRPPASQQ